jgi:hypothetical protein
MLGTEVLKEFMVAPKNSVHFYSKTLCLQRADKNSSAVTKIQNCIIGKECDH